jgi:prevent-host-death family protein
MSKGDVMRTFSIRAAKTHLSRLIDQAAKGESFVITKAGKPLVRVMALESGPDAEVPAVGSPANQVDVPTDLDRLSAAEVEQPFDDDV